MVREMVARALMLSPALHVMFLKVILLFSMCFPGKQEHTELHFLSHAVAGNIPDSWVELSASIADREGKKSPFSTTVAMEKSILIPAPH